MVILNYLFLIFVQPLRLLLEAVFAFAYRGTHNAGASILLMSLAINLLLLPLYFKADTLERQQRAKKASMKPWVDKINAAFKGDERVMILQAYYRMAGYRTTDVLKESISLFLQIPFFIAAYSFLSHLGILSGTPLGPIRDLGLPDGLITLGGISINALPVLMTLINIASGLIYSEKGHIKDKLKLIAIALVFLVLLYSSPSGLVFYWTLNNLFSLIKNIVVHFIKLPAPPEAVKKDKGPDKDMRLIYLSCTCLAVITGLMIPADIIDKNPLELVNTFIPDPHSPMSYLMSSALVAAGTFMLWIPLFIYLIKGKHGRVISYAFVAITTVSIVNQLAFNKDFGLLSYRLIYERPMSYGAIDITVNLIADIAVFSVVMLIGLKKTEFLKKLLAVLLISVFIILGTSVGFFIYAYHGTRYEDYSETDIKLPMTTTGQNVVVLMMDRMISGYIPYIFSENPDLVRQFDGFTYYPNTVSFGAHTNFAAPALYGGYEYTPDKLNERSDELLKDKHNEALRVLPTIFSNNGWDVTVGDAPLANYQWFSDNSIYDYDDNIHAYNISLSMKSDSLSEVGDEMEYCLNRNFFCYGLMRTLPYFLQPLVYTDGTYNSLSSGAGMDNLYGTYQREHMALTSLDDLALITDEAQDSFLLICNGTTHDVCLLSDETYDAPPVVNGIPMYLDDAEDYKHYQCNREALLAIGEWLDFLRENGLYDNTRIILVSDHGYGLSNFDDLLVCGLNFDAEWVNPVLMVKDFGQTGFTVSNELMTNADTPYLALNGVISDPVNPYTGMPITQTPKDDAQLIYISHEFNVTTNNGTQYKDSKGYWLTVEDNIYDDDNWHLAEEDG